MSHDIAAIVSNPEDFGMVWEYEHVKKSGMDLGAVPHLAVTDIPTFRETLGDDTLLNVLNGSNSIRVGCQSITRNAKWADRNTSDDTMKTACVKWLLGIRSGRTPKVVEVYVGPDGTKYTDRDECAAAWMAHNG